MADYRPSLTGSDKPVRVELLFSGITAIKKGLVGYTRLNMVLNTFYSFYNFYNELKTFSNFCLLFVFNLFSSLPYTRFAETCSQMSTHVLAQVLSPTPTGSL